MKLLITAVAILGLSASAAQAHEYCREYDTPIVINGKHHTIYGTACMQPDGTWRQVSTEGMDFTPFATPQPAPYVPQQAYITQPRYVPQQAYVPQQSYVPQQASSPPPANTVGSADNYSNDDYSYDANNNDYTAGNSANYNAGNTAVDNRSSSAPPPDLSHVPMATNENPVAVYSSSQVNSVSVSDNAPNGVYTAGPAKK